MTNVPKASVLYGHIESAAYFIESECPASGTTDAMAIYEKRSDAKKVCDAEHKIIQIKIIK